MLFVDLDYFKNINGAIGNLTGDRVIQIAGKRLQTCVSEQGAVVHVGGDEFSVILDDIYNEEEILAVAYNMLTALSDASQVDCKEILHQVAVASFYIREALKI